MQTQIPSFPQTLLFFNDVAQLRGFKEFRVERNFPVKQGEKPSCSVVFNVVGVRDGSREVLAETPAELPAAIFRDLFAIAAR
ncbi:TPA: hypothetical protein ACIRVE_005372 [Pseudomonas putida]